jgi:hypothetical protein
MSDPRADVEFIRQIPNGKPNGELDGERQAPGDTASPTVLA